MTVVIDCCYDIPLTFVTLTAINIRGQATEYSNSVTPSPTAHTSLQRVFRIIVKESKGSALGKTYM